MTHVLSEWKIGQPGISRPYLMHTDVERWKSGSDAPDGTVLRDPQIREMATDALRHAVFAARFRNLVAAEGAEPIRRLCELARARDLRVEQLLIMIKESWQALPEARRLLRQDAEDILARVITASIEEYYHSSSRQLAD